MLAHASALSASVITTIRAATDSLIDTPRCGPAEKGGQEKRRNDA